MKKINFLFLIPFLLLIAGSCKKKKKDAHVPPDVNLKSGGNYTSGDKTLAHGDSILVGIIAKKTEDDLRSYNASYAYDGAGTTTTFFNVYLSASEYEYYEKDLWLKTRAVAGSEKWTFSIVDKDGNITQKSLVLTVQ
ncbi:MAG: hypothetical protein ACJ76F_02050 [Bacteroidia bacterium]